MIDFPALILIALIGLYLIVAAFLTALWAVAPDRPYWSKSESAWNWFLLAALWPVRLLCAAAYIVWAIIKGLTLAGFKAVLKHRRLRVD